MGKGEAGGISTTDQLCSLDFVPRWSQNPCLSIAYQEFIKNAYLCCCSSLTYLLGGTQRYKFQQVSGMTLMFSQV